jgi:hypothetical protein
LTARTFCLLALFVEFLTEAQLHLSRRFVSKRDGRYLLDFRSSRGEHFSNPANQLRGFARAGRRFHDQAFVERRANALSRFRV